VDIATFLADQRMHVLSKKSSKPIETCHAAFESTKETTQELPCLSPSYQSMPLVLPADLTDLGGNLHLEKESEAQPSAFLGFDCLKPAQIEPTSATKLRKRRASSADSF
jgi:hypothetical protein